MVRGLNELQLPFHGHNSYKPPEALDLRLLGTAPKSQMRYKLGKTGPRAVVLGAGVRQTETGSLEAIEARRQRLTL